MKVRIPNQGGGSQQAMLRQVQEIQKNMADLQEDLEQREYTATSGGGMVEVTVDGKHLIKSLKLSEELLAEQDAEMCEDLIITAVNEAISNAAATADSEMGALTGGLNIPGL